VFGQGTRAISAGGALRSLEASSAGVLALALAVLWIALPQSGFAALHQADRLPTLTTVRSVHDLSAYDARRAYPVYLHAVVTYYDPYLNAPHPMCFVTDETGSIFARLPDGPAVDLKAGDLVEVRGVTSPGEFAASVADARIRVLGQTALPLKAPNETMAHLSTGAEDAQWVEVEGVVQSVENAGSADVRLKIGLGDGVIAATTVQETGVDYSTLVDAKVSIRGIAGSLFDHRRQITGAELLFPGFAAVKIEKPAPAHPFRLAVTPIRDLMLYVPGGDFSHRSHIRGTVTLFWPGRTICVQDGTEGLCADTLQTTSLSLGEVADVMGFPSIGDFTPTLTHAIYQGLPDRRSVPVHSTDAERAFRGDYDAQLIQIEGQLIRQDVVAGEPTLILSSGKFIFSASLPKSADTRAWLGLADGTKVRITGICSVQADKTGGIQYNGYQTLVPKSFRLILRSSDDVVVVQRPSWWTARHSLMVLSAALAVTLCVLCWVFALRHRLKRQTKLLRYQATHDGLTGIWNRMAVLDLLSREVDNAARVNKSVGLMMLDADHFKQVNDTYGHLAGDTVLKELAKRIQQMVRSEDLTGRYGGEEFLVVLPQCDEEDIQLCAERIRSAVADAPISADGSELSMTVSVGTAILDPSRGTLKDALAAADSALYRAKHSGRNRVVSHHERSRSKVFVMN
jgi:diguanylate cyclase (GGDEF)-like protein